MNFKFLAASVLAASALPAFAVGPGDLGFIDNMAIAIGDSVGPVGVFKFPDETYTFSIADPGTVSGKAFSLPLGSLYGTSFFGVTLRDASSTVVGHDFSPANGFSFANLSAGSYSLNFFGKTTGSLGAVYAGVIASETAPVPEPHTYALMMAGIGVVGFVVARRRKQG
jgi:PEP-CTERM motif